MIYGNLCVVVFLTAVCLQQVLGHSWIACTDYMEKNGRYYDHDKCRGYARTSKTLAPRGGTFGEDKGYDYHASETKPCRNARNDGTEYDAKHPIAVYYPGQQVVLAHPMKNHGSASCTNQYIPDHGNHIYRGEKDARSDPTLSDFRKNLVADLGVKDSSLRLDQYPRPGYQNAPAFCENTDKSLGTYSFNVPKDIGPGRYTFIWLWGFNSPQDLYSTCFEVDIVQNGIERKANLMRNGFGEFYEPCGGETSKKSIIGNSNPGCVGGTISPPTTTSGSTSSRTTRSTATSPSTTTSGRTSRTTTSKPSTTPSTTAPGEVKLPVLALQIAGVVNLPSAHVGTRRREIDFLWPCPVDVNFWPVVVTERKELPGAGVHYKLVQEGPDVAVPKLYYHASLTQPCDLKANQPEAKLITDEK